MMARPPFHRIRRGGTVAAAFDRAEADVLGQVCRQLAGLFASASGTSGVSGEVIERLFPRAYLDPTEEEAEAEWQRLVHDDLVAGRRRALEVVRRSLADAPVRRGRLELTLSEDQAQAWLSVLNDARLALGTQLGVKEDLDLSRLDSSSPESAPYAMYGWLSFLEEHLVQALSG